MNGTGVNSDGFALEEGDWISVLVDGKEQKAIVLDTLEDERGYGIVIQTAGDRELIIGPEHIVSTE